jgi:hypothetical protein
MEPVRELDERLDGTIEMTAGELADLIDVRMDEVRQRVADIPKIRPGPGGGPLDDLRSNVRERIESTIESNARFRSSGDFHDLTATRHELQSLWETVQELSPVREIPDEPEERGEADAADVPVIRGGGDE